MFSRRPDPRFNRGRIATVAGNSVVPMSFFDLGAWDFSQISGLDADTVTTGIANVAGSGANTMTPIAAPSLDDAGIGGNRALLFTGTSVNYLMCNALASRFTIGNAWTVVVRYRSTKAADMPLFAAGLSSSAVNTFFRVFQTTGSKLRIDTNTTTTGTIQRTGTIGLNYDEHIAVVTCSVGGTIKAYIDGAIDTLSSSTMDPAALACDRFAVAALLSTSAAITLDGYVSWFGMSTSEATAQQVLTLYNQLTATDFVRPKASSKQVMWVGDSITETSVNTTWIAGIREYELQNVVDLGLSLNHVGSRVNGNLPDRENVAQGGANMATITTNVVNAFAGDPSLAPDLIIVMMGTNDISGGTTASQLASYRTALNAIYSTAVARKSTVKIAVSTITPVQAGTSPADTNWPLFNAGLTAAGTGEWDVFEATNPGVLIRCDNAAAVGNAWSSGDFGADTTHPNETGCQKIGAAQMLVYGTYFRALSSTLKPLGCLIKAPAASASLPYNFAVTVTGRVSRYPSTVVVKQGSTTLGSATMNKRDWSYTWTPLLADLGAQTLNATVTDTIDGTTANAPSVSVTVVSEPTPATIFGADLLQWCRADLGITNASGVSAWLDQSGLGNGYAQGTVGARPVYTASDATLSNLPTMTFDGTTDFLSCTTLNLPAPGTTPTYIWVLVKQNAWTSGARIVDGINGGGATTHYLYQNGVSPALEQSNGIGRNNNNQLAIGTWGALGAGFINSTADFTQVNSAAKVTGAGSAGNAASTGRRLGCNFSGFAGFASISVAEIIYAKRMPTASDLTQLAAYRTTRYGF